MATEEDSIEQAAAARRERLRALKAAQELLNTPDEDSAQVERKTNNENGATEEKWVPPILSPSFSSRFLRQIC